MTENFYKNLVLTVIIPVFLFSVSALLSGCAKTAYPVPPIVVPPSPPKIVLVKKRNNFLDIVYKYKLTSGIKAFLIYENEKGFKKKTKNNFSCSQTKLIAIQNLRFIDKFMLKPGLFFYKIKKTGFKKKYYYIFCLKAVDNLGIQSAFSSYAAIHVN